MLILDCPKLLILLILLTLIAIFTGKHFCRSSEMLNSTQIDECAVIFKVDLLFLQLSS